jgi:hypothetical protein
VSRRSVVASAAALVCVAAAALLAVVAVDAWRWRGQLEEADVRYAAFRGDQAMWEPETVLPAAVSRDALGVADDVAFRHAVQEFRLANPRRRARDLADVGRRGRVELRLGRLARTDPSRERRSLAANLRGALAFEEARGDQGGQTGVFLRRALTEFRDAIRLDPGNEAAKYNLELVLRLLQSTQDDGPAGGGGARADTPASGAGAASTGSGY